MGVAELNEALSSFIIKCSFLLLCCIYAVFFSGQFESDILEIRAIE